MATNINYSDKFVKTDGVGKRVDELVEDFKSTRKNFERRWYDNNFFYDGFHFRYLSRTTGKIVDTSQESTMPTRSIPKASRQLDGVANLLLTPDYVPTVYPKPIRNISKTVPAVNPQTGQPAMDQTGALAVQPNPEYAKEYLRVKEEAKKIGRYLDCKWDDLELDDKVVDMVLKAGKHSISYLQFWKDPVEEEMRSKVYDAFDIYLAGNLDSIYDSPAIIKAGPEQISRIKANELFDREQVEMISADNKYASSEIKEAYEKSKYGGNFGTQTVILKEAFIKEYISESNLEDLVEVAQRNPESMKVLQAKKMGDMIMRHVFSAGGIWLLDEFVDLKEYPFVDFRFKPGPIYQTPLIENFIGANKSLDTVVSRIERFTNTMVVGTWMKRKNEEFEISNQSGGQVISYTNTPPIQGQIASIPPFMFQYIQFLNSVIEEQGASSAALNILPSGVKSGVAIESIKASEYANLKIPSKQLKRTVKHIAEKILEVASTFVYPQTVQDKDLEDFDIIGQEGADQRQAAGMPQPEAVVVSKDYKVKIEVESGMGFTPEGKKDTMQQIITFLTQMMTMKLVSMDQVKTVTQKFLETYQFGATAEFMDGFDNGAMQASQLSDDQIMQVKIAVLEVLKETGFVGKEADQRNIDTTKIGVVEAMKDLGMTDKETPKETTAEPQEEAPQTTTQQMPTQMTQPVTQ